MGERCVGEINGAHHSIASCSLSSVFLASVVLIAISLCIGFSIGGTDVPIPNRRSLLRTQRATSA